MLSPPLECVACGGAFVFFHCGLKLYSRYTGFGASWVVQANASLACALPRTTQHELQSDLQISATCAGLGGVWERANCEPSLADASAGSGAT